MGKISKVENKAYTYMRDHITQTLWLKGKQIKELDVAKELGISRTPVRKALKRLEAEDLVSIEPNKGVYVLGEPLGLKERKDRIYFLEAVLQHILYTLQLEESKVDAEVLEGYLVQMEASVLESKQLFENVEIVFWATVLSEHENDYMNQSVTRTLAGLYDSESDMAAIFEKSRPIKLTHYKKLTEFIVEGNYTYARREVRIMLNQLLINLIQGVD